MPGVEQKPSLSSAAYSIMKRDIVRCKLMPGEELTENGLAAEYGFGRTPVREALGLLADEGLVKPVPRRGYLVASINFKDVLEIFALRLLLEPEACRLAATSGRLDRNHLLHLAELLAAPYDAADRDAIAEALHLHTEFHISIARASGNDRLAAIITGLVQQTERYFHVQIRLRNRRDETRHKELAQALVAGNGELAAEICMFQIRAAHNRVVEDLFSNPQSLSLRLD